jgi:addiction module RelE/StbE family toxin
LSSWIAAYSTQFRRDYEKLKKINPQIKEKTDNAMTVILHSHNPRKLGRHKIDKMDCIYGYDIDSKHRLLYEVFDEKREVVFYRIGSHGIYKQKLQRIRP